MRRFLAAIVIASLSATLFAQGTKADYDRSDGLAARIANKVSRLSVRPHWLDGGRAMWYVIDGTPGKSETYYVDARTGAKQLAFDRARLAKALSVPETGLSVAIESLDGDKVAILANN